MAQKIDAETLFQTKTVAEIRTIEAKTRREIEEKKAQLRQVVGDSYRDLIASADTIVGISDRSRKVASTLDLLEQKLEALSTEVDSKRSNANDDAGASSYDKLFAVGSRIKYLIDSPETIYGCLDSKEFLPAAQRYVKAVEVHRSFAANSKHTAKRFPLLRHHWPLVKKLGTETWDRAVEWLRSQGGATPPQLGGVLAGLALLRPVDGAEVLKHHLAARQAYICSCLSSAASGESPLDPEALSIVLADVAELVCTTIAQCGELFLSRPGVTARPLLVDLAGKEDLSASELLFDPASAKESAESVAWKKHQAEACERLSGLASAGVALECSQWLEGLASQVAPLCEKLLEGCDSGAALHKVEVGVHEAMAAWRYKLGNTNAVQGTTDASNTESGTSNTALEEFTWTDACQWVVGHPVSLWPLLLEGPLVSRAKGLIAAQFDAVGSQAGELIQAALTESLAMPPSAPGHVNPGRWSDALELAPEGLGILDKNGAGNGLRRNASTALRRTTSIRPDSALGGVGGARGHQQQQIDPKWWLPRAEALLAAVDANLDAALAAALAVTEAGSSLAAPASAAGPSPRTVVLQPFVQDKCSVAVESVSSALSAAAASLPQPDGDAESFGHSACAALFIGRVAQGLADRSAPLRLLLGPPSAWSTAKSASKAPRLHRFSSSAPATTSRGPEITPKLDAAQRRLRSIAADSYRLWVTWASRGLAEQLVLQAAGDAALAADAPLRGWEEAVLPGSADAGGDVKFLLPASPSPAAMAAALGACREIERAGGAAADAVPVQLLRWQLAGDICAALRAAFATGGPFSAADAVSEKGLLQLLFDLRFLTAMLEAAPPAESPPTAAAARIREVSATENELAGHIDPIDWATYEAHLYSRVTQFNQRSKTLLGLALKGAPAAKSAAAAGGAAPAPAAVTQPVESNILRMAPAGSRFPYLPVNTPAALRQQRPQIVAPAAAAALLDDGEESQYSFASLATGRSRPASSASSRDGATGGSAAAAAGVGAGAFEALRQSTLGSLLGDKAAEMSATFGEWSSSTSNLTAATGGGGFLSGLTSLPSFSKR